MTEHSGLTQRERLQKCRELAEDARIAAKAGDTQAARAHYLALAAQWAGIVADIERRQGLPNDAAESQSALVVGGGSPEAQGHRVPSSTAL